MGTTLYLKRGRGSLGVVELGDEDEDVRGRTAITASIASGKVVVVLMSVELSTYLELKTMRDMDLQLLSIEREVLDAVPLLLLVVVIEGDEKGTTVDGGGEILGLGLGLQ